MNAVVQFLFEKPNTLYLKSGQVFSFLTKVKKSSNAYSSHTRKKYISYSLNFANKNIDNC